MLVSSALSQLRPLSLDDAVAPALSCLLPTTMQPPYRAVKNLSLPRAEFLSLGASDILGWITLGCCELSKHWLFSSLSVSSDNQKYV